MYKTGKETDVSVTGVSNVLDVWILNYRNKLVADVTHAMEVYDLITATREIREFIGNVSQWYLRRSRERIKKGDKEALNTLHTIVSDVSRLLAPFTPFFAEDIYQRVGGTKESVHLERWPEGGDVDDDGLAQMSTIRALITKALEKRAEAGLKVRQPLATLTVDTDISDEYIDIVKSEVNIKDVVHGEETALDTTLTDELKREGVVRELIRAIQEMRKKVRLDPHDTTGVRIATHDDGMELLEAWRDDISATAGLSAIEYADDVEGEEVSEHDFHFVLALSDQ